MHGSPSIQVYCTFFETCYPGSSRLPLLSGSRALKDLMLRCSTLTDVPSRHLGSSSSEWPSSTTAMP